MQKCVKFACADTLKEDKNKQKGNTENPVLTSPGNCLI